MARQPHTTPALANTRSRAPRIWSYKQPAALAAKVEDALGQRIVRADRPEDQSEHPLHPCVALRIRRDS